MQSPLPQNPRKRFLTEFAVASPRRLLWIRAESPSERQNVGSRARVLSEVHYEVATTSNAMLVVVKGFPLEEVTGESSEINSAVAGPAPGACSTSNSV